MTGCMIHNVSDEEDEQERSTSNVCMTGDQRISRVVVTI
jgi:ribonuclease PH